MIASAHDLIEAKGVSAIAEATRREPGAVRVWKHRNRIPRDAWPELMDAYPGEITLDVLRRFEDAA
ncbi:MAG: hypothetical protein JWQ97_3545 [Phenylobacterium sp.]|nr:hypothetical protein [Phenylobacterium sp.]